MWKKGGEERLRKGESAREHQQSLAGFGFMVSQLPLGADADLVVVVLDATGMVMDYGR